MSDTRPISDFRFGLEWEPKLAAIMLQHPWSDSAFSMSDPRDVCKKCGRAPGSIQHAAGSVDSHVFEESDPFTEAQIASAREQWQRRMAGLPTEEALEAWHKTHALDLSRLHAMLMACKVKTRDDVEALGCTGCVASGLTIEDAKFLRMGLAGSGVGLPCYVPPDRYCYVHGVSGGLQDGQTQQHVFSVDSISRPLNATEAGHDKLVAAARRGKTERDTHGMLHGHELPKGWEENVDALREEGGIDDIVEAGRQRPVVVKPWDDLAADMSPERRAAVQARVDTEVTRIQERLWKCTEHEKTDWTCRHCVAQAVIEGELTPVFRIAGPMGVGVIAAADIDAKIAELSKGSLDHAEIFVQAAAFTRKLSRD